MKKITTTALAMLFAFVMNAQEESKTEFQPNGKPTITIFSNWHQGLEDNVSDDSGFELDRVYLGYAHKFSENWSAKAVYDIKNSNGAYHAFAKNALLSYKKGPLAISMGMTGGKLFKLQEKTWGYRYLYKSAMDEHKFGHSADLGITADYKLSDMLALDLAIFNGEGYKSTQDVDGNYRLGLGATTKPVENLTVRAYYDIHLTDTVGSRTKQHVVALFANYKLGNLSLSAEYNMMQNDGFVEDANFDIISAYATYKINSDLKAFGRFDMITNKAADTSDNTLIAGVEYQPTKNIKLAPNIKSDLDGASYLFLNLGIKF